MIQRNLPANEGWVGSTVPATSTAPDAVTFRPTHSIDATSDERTGVSMTCPCCGSAHSRYWMKVPDRVSEGDVSFDLVRCSSCKHIWISNPPTASQLSRYYGPEYHNAVGRTGETTPWRWQRALRAISKYKTDGSLLDIGCSSGGFLSYLKPSGWKLYGIEPDQPTAARAHSISGGEITVCGVDDATFPPESFDVITCSDVLEHLPDPRAVFQKVALWLKPTGIFYVFVPNIGSWESRMFGSHWYGLDIPRHLHHFSFDSLKSVASLANLSPTQILTPPGCYLEQSCSVLLNDLSHAHNGNHNHIDLSGDLGVSWKILRKVVRLTIETPYAHLASGLSGSPSIQAIFSKSAATSASIK